MDDFRLLQFLDKFQALFRKLGIDYAAMRAILQLKLTMDGRRMPAIFNGGKQKKEGNQFYKSLWVYLLYGLLLQMPFLFLGDNYMFGLGIMFSVLLFFLMSSMVSDFSSVLLDVRDKNNLLARPINKKTLNTAKVIHIGYYITLLTLSFVAVPVIVSVFVQGIFFAIIFIIEVMLIALLSLTFTALAYYVILRFFSGEKLKDMISYVQIALAIFIMVGYQFFGRVFEITNLDLTYTFKWWHIILPPLWYGAPFELLLNQNNARPIILLSILAILMPILALSIYIRSMPGFESSLTKLQTDSIRKRKRKSMWTELWAKVLCSSPIERTLFGFSSMMITKERELKIKLYPLLAFSLLIPIIFFFNNFRFNSLEEIKLGSGYLQIYFALLMIPTVVHMLQYSAAYKAIWILQVAPIANRQLFYSATLKAFLVKYFLPIYFLLCVFFIWVYGWDILFDLVIVLLAAICTTVLTYKILNGGVYPFSESPQSIENTGTIKTLTTMAVIGVFAFIHLKLGEVPYGKLALTVVLLIAIPTIWRLVFLKSKRKGAVVRG